MFGRAKIVVFTFVLLMCFSLFFPALESKAADVYYSQFNEPTANEYSGYINLEVDLDDDATKVVTLVWNIIPMEVIDSSLVPTTMMDIAVNQRSVTMRGVSMGLEDFHMVVWELNTAGEALLLFSGYPSAPYSLSDSFNGDIVGFSVYGNYGHVTSYMGTYNPCCSVVWNDEAESISKMSSMISYLNLLSTKLDKLTSEVDNVEEELIGIKESVDSCLARIEEYLPAINNSLDGIEVDIESIQVLLNKEIPLMRQFLQWSNTYLGGINEYVKYIYEEIKKQPEEEKEQAQTQGNQSVSDVTNAVDDKSAGFMDSVSGLVSSMSYGGTECAWKFPAITLPAIDGVMPSYQLTSEQTIDFAYWVNAIPSDILLLIRSVCTIGLIVYCFKEFYDVISYVLTLKGGGAGE